MADSSVHLHEAPNFASAQEEHRYFYPPTTKSELEAECSARPDFISIRYAKYKLHTPEQMKAAYEVALAKYEADPVRPRLMAMLDTLVGKVDRIVVIALGSPSDGMPGGFRQSAMLATIKDKLSGASKDHDIEMFGSDPAFTDLDRSFLQQELGMVEIPFDREPARKDRRPPFYYFHLSDEKSQMNYINNAWNEKQPIHTVAEQITDRTLFFVLGCPQLITLRAIQAANPVAVIGHEPFYIHNFAWFHDPANGLTSEQGRRHFGVEWENCVEGCRKLMGQYQRKMIENPHCGGWWLYKKIDAKGIVEGWQTGEEGFPLDWNPLDDLKDSSRRYTREEIEM